MRSGPRQRAFQDAALASAVRTSLMSLIPARTAELDAAFAATPARIPAGPSKDRGAAAGAEEATALLTERTGDGLDPASVSPPYPVPQAAENVDARVRSGIHTRSADRAGVTLGRQVASYALRHDYSHRSHVVTWFPARRGRAGRRPRGDVRVRHHVRQEPRERAGTHVRSAAPWSPSSPARLAACRARRHVDRTWSRPAAKAVALDLRRAATFEISRMTSLSPSPSYGNLLAAR
ncbi:hypothetical protein [Nonomuraea jabiensis]|uniref:hypothetical protein n=1 Tax=Nonomuraea jabiensis TaxID=882448 RepID=UPI003674FF3B